ncbi:hypothetical protein [Motiliproteus sediminis]|uniref:hypothetical protein n=1 Tax=Motiliproteus sediminis TaxID=1468178 RepID=UPI001AEFDC07|nr:hypothetical protein [Motiliproteus sediminis]
MRLHRLICVLLTALGVAPVLADSSRNNPTMDWLPPAVDWQDAQTLILTLDDYWYQPNDIELTGDQPYRVVLNNVSDVSTHDLVDLAFFHAVVLYKVNVDGIELVTPHIHNISLRPNSKATLYLVPKVAGEYEVFCSVPGHREEGMDGLVTIIEPGSPR